MTSNNIIISYEDLQNTLDDGQLLITAAEIHGLLMGFYSAGLSHDDTAWKQQITKHLKESPSMKQFIDQHFTAVNNALCKMINAEIFGLQLLLPDDNSTTVARGEALGYWCQGFILGYHQVTELKDGSDVDLDDALSDIEEISNIDLDSIGKSEEDEKSLFQLTEHIKVSAQLIHSIVNENNGLNSQKDAKTLH